MKRASCVNQAQRGVRNSLNDARAYPHPRARARKETPASSHRRVNPVLLQLVPIWYVLCGIMRIITRQRQTSRVVYGAERVMKTRERRLVRETHDNAILIRYRPRSSRLELNSRVGVSDRARRIGIDCTGTICTSPAN